MNRCNIITGIDLLRFAIEVNQQMIKGGHALTGAAFNESDVLALQAEIIGAAESIEQLEILVREDQLREETAKCFTQQADGGCPVEECCHNFHD